MGFFADRPRPAVVEPASSEIEFLGSGMLPRRRVLPGQVATRIVVFHTSAAVLVFDHFEVYPTGVGFRANLQLRDSSVRLDDLVLYGAYPWSSSDEPPEEFLRLGVVFSDGSSWSNIDFVEFGEDRPGPTLEFLDGAGGAGSWTMNVWISPLPPDGELAFIAEWPVFGIAETRATIDAAELRRAADRVEELWPS